MIGVLTHGRMGNQMFQYAFGYTTSKRLGTRFFICKPNSLKYFKANNHLGGRNKMNMALYMIAANVLTKSRYKLWVTEFRKPITLKNYLIKKNILDWPHDFNDGDFLHKIKNHVIYDGYFQSESYLKGYEYDIRALFDIQQRHKTLFKKYKNHLFNKRSVAVHLRRTDYINFGSKELGGRDLTLPTNYYSKCIAMIKGIEDYNVIFVSDDIEFTKREFGTKENYFFESNDEITDFQILLNADVLIIANSTFSWWAAWLNNKAEKVIYAPNYFLGFKVKKFYPKGIKVDSWNWIDVN